MVRPFRLALERTLHSKVALRMAILFIGCAVTPLVGLAVLTVNRTTSQLEQQASAQLRYDVKSSAMEALDRLYLLENALRLLGTAVASGKDPLRADQIPASMAATLPSALVYLPDDDEPRPLRGSLRLAPLSSDQQHHLAGAGRLLVTHHAGDGASGHVLLVRVDTTAGGGTVAGLLDYRAIFSLDAEVLPPFSHSCVSQRGSLLACSPDAPMGGMAHAASVRTDGEAPDNSELGEYFVRTWALPLRASHLGEPWVVSMMRPKAAVLGPLRRFVRDFWMVLVLSILVVSWVSLSQVRRQLEPLASLVRATERLARRDFDRAVDVRSGDEFEELGKAFNQLSHELKRQFAHLEAFNLGTLAALGRAIDAKSPWTSGHSERVTRLAVALAEEMKLPAEEIEDLRRAGLIHDIGKLATPPGILDKPGRLTSEELQVMRQHTLQGVHILEPIPMYERLLPVVGQHHERWDGAGYPHGLSGAAIARTARVLAVADVCDALGADRPYHTAMTKTEVLEHVRLRSGTQFDPEVVEALVRLMHRNAGEAGTPQESAIAPSRSGPAVPADDRD